MYAVHYACLSWACGLTFAAMAAVTTAFDVDLTLSPEISQSCEPANNKTYQNFQDFVKKNMKRKLKNLI